MKYRYPVYRPHFTGKEKQLILECIDSTWISSKGIFIAQFEKLFSSYLGTNYSVTVSNGTVALHTALLALGIGPGDEVLVPTLTYISSANAVSYTGANVVFVDCETNYWQMDVKAAEKKITSKTKAIMPVHLYGHSCDMDSIIELAKRYSLFIVEDCAEAIGTRYRGQLAGTFGDIACFSFFGNKTITTGEGGIVATNNSHLEQMMSRIKGQGLAIGKEYWHDIIGFNYRMTNICAAIGCAQLEAVNEIIQKKHIISDWYKENLLNFPVTIHPCRPDTYHSYWMVSILCDDKVDRDPLRSHLRENGIETRPLFYPLHLMDIYSRPNEVFPVSEDIAFRGINLPSYPDLSKIDVFEICKHIIDYFDINKR